MGGGKVPGVFGGTKGGQMGTGNLPVASAGTKGGQTGTGNLPGASAGTKGNRASATIHQDRQDKHIVGTKNYKQEIANDKHPSILTEDASQLLKEAIGKNPVIRLNKEVVDYDRIIGKWYDPEKKKYYDTTRATIHFDSKNKAHIVPSIPKAMLP